MTGYSFGHILVILAICTLFTACGGSGGGSAPESPNEPEKVLGEGLVSYDGATRCQGENALTHSVSAVESFNREITFEQLKYNESAVELAEGANGYQTRLVHQGEGVTFQGVKTSNDDVIFSVYQSPFNGFVQGSVLRDSVSLWGFCKRENASEVNETQLNFCKGQWVFGNQTQSRFDFIVGVDNHVQVVKQFVPEYKIEVQGNSEKMLLVVSEVESDFEVASAIVTQIAKTTEFDFKLSKQMRLSITCNKVKE